MFDWVLKIKENVPMLTSGTSKEFDESFKIPPKGKRPSKGLLF